MRSLGLIVAAVGGLAWFANDAQAQQRVAVQTLTQSTFAVDAAIGVQATPVTVGWGWGNRGYYGGNYNRGYYNRSYYGGGYYGGNNYYRNGYYGNGYRNNYYRGNPYYNSYRAPYYRYR
jgi:hypothetical protein